MKPSRVLSPRLSSLPIRLASAYRGTLARHGFRFSATDEQGDVRGGELDGHPFYVGTLFQPERSALRGEAAPLVEAFVRAVAGKTWISTTFFAPSCVQT